jgi:hypothetical protein
MSHLEHLRRDVLWCAAARHHELLAVLVLRQLAHDLREAKVGNLDRCRIALQRTWRLVLKKRISSVGRDDLLRQARDKRIRKPKRKRRRFTHRVRQQEVLRLEVAVGDAAGV